MMGLRRIFIRITKIGSRFTPKSLTSGLEGFSNVAAARARVSDRTKSQITGARIDILDFKLLGLKERPPPW
jgi:hypothetical protein